MLSDRSLSIFSMKSLKQHVEYCDTSTCSQGFVDMKIKVVLGSTELAKKVCPGLHDSACWRSGEITQPRTNFLANSV